MSMRASGSKTKSTVGALFIIVAMHCKKLTRFDSTLSGWSLLLVTLLLLQLPTGKGKYIYAGMHVLWWDDTAISGWSLTVHVAFVWADGDWYEGEWADGKENGKVCCC